MPSFRHTVAHFNHPICRSCRCFPELSVKSIATAQGGRGDTMLKPWTDKAVETHRANSHVEGGMPSQLESQNRKGLFNSSLRSWKWARWILQLRNSSVTQLLAVSWILAAPQSLSKKMLDEPLSYLNLRLPVSAHMASLRSPPRPVICRLCWETPPRFQHQVLWPLKPDAKMMALSIQHWLTQKLNGNSKELTAWNLMSLSTFFHGGCAAVLSSSDLHFL